MISKLACQLVKLSMGALEKEFSDIYGYWIGLIWTMNVELGCVEQK